MEKYGSLDGGLLLLDHIDDKALLLYESFVKGGFSGVTLVIEDDGFIPDEMIGLYRFFLKKGNPEVCPRFFNQIDVEDYWVIKANNHAGEIFDMGKLKGRINYTKRYKDERRIVSSVDWLDEFQVIRATGYYDIYGDLYSRCTYDSNGKKLIRTYYDESFKEVIVCNLVTGDIILNEGDLVHIFHEKVEFIDFLIDKITRIYDTSIKKIYYNSLGVPFLYTLRKSIDASLIWQEGFRDELPGNMKYILDGKTSTSHIYVQDTEAARHFKSLIDRPQMIEELGYLYSFSRNNRYSRNVFIFTNSDQIVGLTELIQNYPELNFHIAAVTEMSTKLLLFSKYQNVRLYPGISDEMCRKLFQKCDIYLDINRGNELLNTIHKAFLENMLILALEETKHNTDYIPKEHIYSDIESLMEVLSEVLKEPDVWDRELEKQREHAMLCSAVTYRNMFI